LILQGQAERAKGDKRSLIVHPCVQQIDASVTFLKIDIFSTLFLFPICLVALRVQSVPAELYGMQGKPVQSSDEKGGNSRVTRKPLLRGSVE
jgi:hypothetical protein